MVFTDDQRFQIRSKMGFSRLFQSANPILESAMTAVDQLQDSGATEAGVIATLASLAAIDTQIGLMQTQVSTLEITGELKMNAIRALKALRVEGYQTVTQLEIAFDMNRFRDVYTGRGIVDASQRGPGYR